MKRNHWLIAATLVLLLANVAWHLWRNWGLVTVHAENRPLSEIIRSIEKQGGVVIRTDMNLTTPVRMNVDKVKLTEALETLSALTDARWRLTYLIGPDKGALGTALATFSSGARVEGWKALRLSVPGFNDEAAIPSDPRRDPWEVKPAAEPKLHAYLQQAVRQVSATFIYPEGFDPAVSSAPKSGPVSKVLPRLASAANAHYQEVFLLQGDRNDGPPRPPGGNEGGDGPQFASFERRSGFDRERNGMDREAFEERRQAELKKMPPAERAEAEATHKFFQDMREMPREQREAKIQEFMNDPAAQERMEKGMSARDSRRSPQQRLERSKKYVESKQAIKSGQAPSGGGGGRGPR